MFKYQNHKNKYCFKIENINLNSSTYVANHGKYWYTRILKSYLKYLYKKTNNLIFFAQNKT